MTAPVIRIGQDDYPDDDDYLTCPWCRVMYLVGRPACPWCGQRMTGGRPRSVSRP